MACSRVPTNRPRLPSHRRTLALFSFPDPSRNAQMHKLYKVKRAQRFDLITS